MILTKGAHQSAKFQNFDCSGEISPNLSFDRHLLLKVYEISAKKVQRSYVSWHWRVMQNLKKNRFCCFKNDKNLVNFDLSAQKSQNFALWLVPFVQSTLKSHARFEEKLTLGLENDMRSLTNFHQNTWKCQNWYFHGVLFSKVENTWAKNLQRSYV